MAVTEEVESSLVPETSDTGPALRRVRTRALVVGLLACFPVTYAVANQNVSAIFSLIVAPVSALIVLLLINVPLRLFAPKYAFTQADLIVIFGIASVAGAVSGEWLIITHPATYSYPLRAPSDPHVKDYFMKYIPDWLAIKNPDLVKDVQGGGKDWLYTLGKMPIFLPIYLGWSILFFSICFAMLCVNSLMRGAWCERERLTFPLIQLPVSMAEGGGSGGMWRSKYMWIAFGIMFSIDILNGLNYLYPNLPSLPVKDLFFINNAFKDPPWSNIGDFRISIYPFMAAVGLFVPSDLLLSMVVFFLCRKGIHVVLASQGIPQSTFSGSAIAPGPPYFDEQTWGGVIALFLGAIWVSKGYLSDVWRDIVKGRKPQDGGISHRWAFVGLIVCWGGVVWFGTIGKLPVTYMIVYFGAFLVFSVVLTRIRAQLGPPTHEFAFFSTGTLLNRFLGSKWITDQQATFSSEAFLPMTRIYRNHPMPYQLEMMKMGQIERLGQKRIFWGIVAATVLAYFLGHFFYQVQAYRTGNIGWWDAGGYLNNVLADRKGPDVLGITMTIFGFAMVMVLDAIRFKFPGFPLHPAGYVLAMNFGVDYYWFGLLIALIVKNFVQRYYGLRGYDKLRSVALGILLGEYAAETIWMTMALITHQSTYTISFNDRSLGAQ